MPYVISDESNNNLVLDGIRLYGKECSLFAIFLHEKDALDVLFAIEKEGVLPGTHVVRKISAP
jgi:hypothetical protein